MEVEDWAENATKKREKILFDNEKPQMDMDNDKNYLITAENQEICCVVTDNQRVETVDGKIICNNVIGERTERKIESWKEGWRKVFDERTVDRDWEI